MSDQPKFCKDCKHYRWNDSKCLVSPKLDLETGDEGFFSAGVIRGSSVPDDCGPEGKLWEAKDEPA